MIVVRTKEELQEAIKNKVDSIRIEGPYAGIVAQKIRSRKKVKKVAIGVGTLALVGGVIAAPFTGGASLAGSAVGLTAMGLVVLLHPERYQPVTMIRKRLVVHGMRVRTN